MRARIAAIVVTAPATRSQWDSARPTPKIGPGHVTFYVEVEDPAAYLARAEKLGGKTVVPPTEIPKSGLTFAFFADPEGHVRLEA